MAFDAAIEIPIVATDESQQTFDAVSLGFRNLAQEGQQLTQTLQQQTDAARMLQTGLTDVGSGFDTLRTSAQSLFTGVEQLTGSFSALSTGMSAQVASVDMLRAAYADLAIQMAATRDAGASMGSLGAGGAALGTGLGVDTGSVYGPNQPAGLNEQMITGYDPNLDRATIASARAGNTIEKTQGLIDNMYTPGGASGGITPAEQATGGGGHGESGVLGQALQQSLVYGGLYAGYSGLKDSLGRDISYSQDLGTTQAMTGLTNAGINSIGNSVTGLASSGSMPYSRDTLLQGDYSVASLGIGGGDPTKVAQVGQIIAQLSAAGGAPDTTQAGDALTSAISIYGKTNSPDVISFAKQQADQLQTAVKLGKADFPDFAGQVGPAMAQGSQLGLQSSDIYAYLAAESAGGVAKGQLGQDLYSLEASTVKPTQQQQTAAASIGLKGDWNSSTISQFGGLSGFTAMLQQRTAGLSDQSRESLLTGLFGNEAAAKGLNSVLDQPDYQSFFSGVQNSQGSAQAAFTTSQSTDGAKLADASVKLQTSFDLLTTATLPALVKGMDALTSGFDAASSVFDNWGKKTPSNPSGATAGDTLLHLLTPGSPGFLNIGAARNQAATGQPDTGFFPSIGSAFDSGVSWLDNPSFGGGTAHAAGNTSGGLEPWQVGSLPNIFNAGSLRNSASPTIVDSYTAPGTIGNALGGSVAPGTNTLNPDLSAAGRSYGGAPSPTSNGSTANPYAASAQQYVSNLNAGGGRGIATLDLRRAEDEVKALLAQTPIDQQAVSAAMGELSSVIDAMPGDPVVKNNTLIQFQQHVNAVIAHSSLKTLRAGLTDLESQYKLDVAHGDTAGASAVGQEIGAFYQTNASALGLSQNTAALDAMKYTGGTGGQTAGQEASRGLRDLQNTASVDHLSGNMAALATAQNAVLAFQEKHAAALGLDTTDIALLKAQNANALRLPTTPDRMLIHPQDTGPGDALAGFDSTTARLSQGGATGANPLSEVVRHLQEQLQAQTLIIAELRKGNSITGDIRDQAEVGTNRATPMPSARGGPVSKRRQ